MQINCKYFGRKKFYGLEIYNELDDDDWEYASVNFYDFVISCLNNNYFCIAAGCDPYVTIDGRADDFDELYRILVEATKQKKINMDVFTDYMEFLSSQKERYFKRYTLIENDLNRLNLKYYTDFFDISSQDQYDLSLKEKYYAYYFSRQKTSIKTSKFSAQIQVEPNSISTNYETKDTFDADTAVIINRSRSDSNISIYDELCKLIQSTSKVNAFVGKYYNFRTFRDTFSFLVHEMINNDIQVKKCKNCGRYFAPDKRGLEYCGMPSPDSPAKTCQEYIRYQLYLKQTHTASARLHKQIYNQKANKVKRSKNTRLQHDLENFKSESEHWRKKVQVGAKTELDYIDWLKSVKEGAING